jgi:predicted lipoprotein with Yx(FWY)xxD motif
MRRLLIFGVIGAAAIVAGIAIAATGGGAAKSGGGTVSAKQISGAGRVLVDSKGRALYRSDQERNGMVLCDGACLSFWQPLTVSGTPKGSSLPGKLAVVKRPDGRRQVTYNGKLLYSFKLDKPGKVTGDGRLRRPEVHLARRPPDCVEELVDDDNHPNHYSLPGLLAVRSSSR